MDEESVETSMIEAQIKKDVLPRIAAKLEKAQDVLVVIKIEEKGAATECHVYDAMAGANGEAMMDVDVKDLVFKQPGLPAGEYRDSFTTLQVDAAMRKPMGPEEGASALIEADFDEVALAYLAEHLDPSEDLEVELWINDKGAVTFAGIYKAMISRTKPVDLSDSDRKKAEGQIRDLGAVKSTVRKKAGETLQGMGRGVLPLVRAAMAKTEDPEVSTRCEAIIGALEQAVDGPGAGEAVKFLKSLKFKGKDVAGKRFLVPVTHAQLERAGNGAGFGGEGYICEMAPGPFGEE